MNVIIINTGGKFKFITNINYKYTYYCILDIANKRILLKDIYISFFLSLSALAYKNSRNSEILEFLNFKLLFPDVRKIWSLTQIFKTKYLFLLGEGEASDGKGGG